MHGNAPRARAGALVFGLAYAAVFVWGLITGDSVAGIIPVDDADQVLHAALAGTALLSALASPVVELRGQGRHRDAPDAVPPRAPAERPAAPAAPALPAGTPSRPGLPPGGWTRAPTSPRSCRSSASWTAFVAAPLRRLSADDPQVQRRARATGRGGCGRRSTSSRPAASSAIG